MLATRSIDPGRNTWSSSKLGAVYHNAVSPRMSNFESLSTQQDWREQYSSFVPPGEETVSFSQHSANSTTPDTKPRSGGRPTLEHRHSIGPLSLREEANPGPTIERPDSAPGVCGNQADDTARTESLVSPVSTGLSLGSNPPSTTSSATAPSGSTKAHGGSTTQAELKEEELDEEEEDDEMLDGDEDSVPQTAAERRAERRKMKRFRLTHQQTRFLMSEFAKQAHPDAAHRERLSREIPGLSPRQVQVWFQNRRAKIKRLTADDRERMMKMRAVPDDFDNVQALHSPYGAVHGIGTPMQSPVDFVPGYADHMMRPLMVDTMRRNDGNEEHMSPTGLSPAFGHIGFAPPGSMSTPDVLSPLSLNSNDRYYPSHLSSPMSAGPRSANMFGRQNSGENYQAHSNSRQPVRPLQPLQLRTTMSRSRSESLQSPLRSSMSWKGETLNYGFQQTGQPSPQLSGRQQSTYQAEQIGNNAVPAHPYDDNAYSNPNMQSSPTAMSYSQPPNSASVLRTSPSSLSRLRSSSSAFPPGLDLRNQYRTLPSQQNSGQHGAAGTPRSGSFASAFTAGFASAPLSAPVDFSLPRTPGEPNPSARDFQNPQLSAPMAPPQDFSNAYNSNMSQQQRERDFGNQAHGQNRSPAGRSRDQSHHAGNQESSYFGTGGSGGYETGHKRKRSFTMPGSFESP